MPRVFWNQTALTILENKRAEKEYPSWGEFTKIAQEIHNSHDFYKFYTFGELERKVRNWFITEQISRRKGLTSGSKKIGNLQKNSVQTLQTFVKHFIWPAIIIDRT